MFDFSTLTINDGQDHQILNSHTYFVCVHFHCHTLGLIAHIMDEGKEVALALNWDFIPAFTRIIYTIQGKVKEDGCIEFKTPVSHITYPTTYHVAISWVEDIWITCS